MIKYDYYTKHALGTTDNTAVQRPPNSKTMSMKGLLIRHGVGPLQNRVYGLIRDGVGPLWNKGLWEQGLWADKHGVEPLWNRVYGQAVRVALNSLKSKTEGEINQL